MFEPSDYLPGLTRLPVSTPRYSSRPEIFGLTAALRSATMYPVAVRISRPALLIQPIARATSTSGIVAAPHIR